MFVTLVRPEREKLESLSSAYPARPTDRHLYIHVQGTDSMFAPLLNQR
jgi:hypothetical protein